LSGTEKRGTHVNKRGRRKHDAGHFGKKITARGKSEGGGCAHGQVVHRHAIWRTQRFCVERDSKTARKDNNKAGGLGGRKS